MLALPGKSHYLFSSKDIARVFKGMRLAGRMGGDRVKVQNLQIYNSNPYLLFHF